MLETASRTHGDSGGLVRDSHDCFPGAPVATATGAGGARVKEVSDGPLGFEAFDFGFEIGFVGAILENSYWEENCGESSLWWGVGRVTPGGFRLAGGAADRRPPPTPAVGPP